VYLTKNGGGDLLVMDEESFARRDQYMKKESGFWYLRNLEK
jgi:hypothetical protein